MTANDQDLRDRFAALRRQEEPQAPGFTSRPASSRKPVRPRSPGTLLAAAAFLLAIAAAGLWLRTASHRPQPEPGKPVASIADWKPPTDFLLDTPGRQLLATVPAIGALQNGSIAPIPAPTPHRKNPQVRKAVSP